MSTKTPAPEFGPVMGPLTKPAALPPLDSGRPDKSVYEALRGLTVVKAFEGRKVKDEGMAQCCLSGLWLLHGYLDESHRISQQAGSPTGSHWHGIMHRREGDYGNSKYWFRRVGEHTIWPELLENGQQIFDREGEGAFSRLSNWDPYQFVDLCAESTGSGLQKEKLCQEVQMREWELLFPYSYQKALGA